MMENLSSGSVGILSVSTGIPSVEYLEYLEYREYLEYQIMMEYQQRHTGCGNQWNTWNTSSWNSSSRRTAAGVLVVEESVTAAGILLLRITFPLVHTCMCSTYPGQPAMHISAAF